VPTRLISLRTLLAVLLALIVGVVTAWSVTATAAPAGRHPGGNSAVAGPVINSNFADPDILVVGKTYHAYATNSGGQNIQHETSRDLKHWTVRPDIAPTLGAWVDPRCTFSPGGSSDRCVWAPDVSRAGNGYVLYYAARDLASQKQCIGVSTSSSPDGPFKPVGSSPLVCPTSEGGAIDPSTYSENGQHYLLWKADGNCCNLPAVIKIQQVSADGLTLTGPATPLIRNDLPFEGTVVEAPDLEKHDGKYFLFYSASGFAGGAYATGYATASSLTGPYMKSRTPLMSTDRFRGKIIGPGGEDVVKAPDGSTKIFFHGWDPTYTYRAMYVRTLTWPGNVPTVQGEPTRYEAENGTIHDAVVVDDNTASGGDKVGKLDNADSSVTVSVHVARGGVQRLGIRFGNGSLDPSGYPVKSSDYLSVNGKRVGTVVFPHTDWGNWTMLERSVHLHQGTNTITLTKATFYAEIDSIDVG
jgi:arabinan endo-1,5-alpha-L-arabinosidase